MERAQAKDSELKTLKKLLETETYEDFSVENNLLYKGKEGWKRLVVPKGMQTEIIRRAHEIGHFETRKTEEIICGNIGSDR